MCRQSREQGATHFEKLSKIIKRIGNILMIIHWLKKKKIIYENITMDIETWAYNVL